MLGFSTWLPSLSTAQTSKYQIYRASIVLPISHDFFIVFNYHGCVILKRFASFPSIQLNVAYPILRHDVRAFAPPQTPQ